VRELTKQKTNNGSLKSCEDTKNKMNKQQLYKIIRFYRVHGLRSKVVKRNVTLDEAQAHCRDPATRKAGEWFDGYESQ